MDAETPTPGAAKPKPAGRPCSLNAQRHEQIVAAAKAGLPQQDVARAGGISERQLREWLKRGRTEARGKFRELFEAVEAAKRESIASLLAIVLAATGPQTTKTTKTVTTEDGTRTEETVTVEPGKWQPAAWLLERRFPEDFALMIVRDVQEILSGFRKLRRDRKKEAEKAEQQASEYPAVLQGMDERDREELAAFRKEKQDREMAERQTWFRDHGILSPDRHAMKTDAAGPQPLFNDPATE